MEDILGKLLEAYGLPGLIIAVLIFFLVRLARRLKEVEDRQIRHETKRYEALIELINDYAALARNNTEVISKLTGCLSNIKDTLERIELRSLK